MAKGAGDEYWASPNLPSKIKHCMMKKYVPIFLGRTSVVSGKVLVDPNPGPPRANSQYR